MGSAAARGVGGQGAVDHLVGQPALGLGGAHTVGVFSEQSGINHLGAPAARGA